MGIGNMSGFEFLLVAAIYLGVPVLLVGALTWVVVRVARAARGTTAHDSELAALRERVARLEVERDRAKL